MSDEFEYDIYISYNSDDRERARRLAERLRDAGLRVWFDEWVIRPGDVIYLKIDHGLLASRVLVLCMSPAAFNSGWVDLERSTVLFRNPTNEERRFIPLLIADCRIPDTVRRYRYIDYRDEGAAAFEELLSVFRPEAERTPGGGEERPGREQEAAGPPPMASLEREIANIESFATSLAFSPDGEVMVSGTDTTVKVWDVETGECRATLKGHRYQVMSVAVT
ncbi:MAG TPA: TIR domain-containing protein, partial [Pyrinomonadaceae bacterium]